MGAWTPQELKQLDPDAFWSPIQHWADQAGDNPVGRAMYLDYRLYLAEGICTKIDRCSMAFGVEVRSPFLDHRLVELMADIPLHFKLGLRRNKVLLRELAAEKWSLPSAGTAKKGFGTPTRDWLLEPFRQELDTLPEQLETWIAPQQLRQVLDNHHNGSDLRRRLFTALMLSRWLQHWAPLSQICESGEVMAGVGEGCQQTLLFQLDPNQIITGHGLDIGRDQIALFHLAECIDNRRCRHSVFQLTIRQELVAMGFPDDLQQRPIKDIHCIGDVKITDHGQPHRNQVLDRDTERILHDWTRAGAVILLG